MKVAVCGYILISENISLDASFVRFVGHIFNE